MKTRTEYIYDLAKEIFISSRNEYPREYYQNKEVADQIFDGCIDLAVKFEGRFRERLTNNDI